MSITPELSQDPRKALNKYFGHRDFLDGQQEVVDAILAGKDTIAVMPTGGGKSLCYQLPAMVMKGITVVVSPLIALMKDQVDALTDKGIPAVMINSSITATEQHHHIECLQQGAYKMVYIAPERFRSEAFTKALQKVEVSLFAIDEAHCLSQWGHDFRPDYLLLGNAIRAIGNPQIAAFTATATPEVRSDILHHLSLRDPFQCVSGFARPNLALQITPCTNRKEKYKRIRTIIEKHETGIIYCATRKRVEEVHETLNAWGIQVISYHGGMPDSEREQNQESFISRETNIAVATNAFGMGIDRSDVRFVIHFDIPGSIEAYYQEAGRAGRDGETAVCELLFNFADTRTQEFFIEGSNPTPSLILDVHRHLSKASDQQSEVFLPIQDLCDKVGARNTMAVSSALSYLVRSRAIERFDAPGQRIRGTRIIETGTPDIDCTALSEKETRDRDKLKEMVNLCYSTSCRQAWILNYFGEEDLGSCNTCDNCIASSSEEIRKPSPCEETAVKQALSGVARMSRRGQDGWQARFGRMKIVQMLVGSRSREILNARLDELSTYGLMKSEGSNYVAALLSELQNAGMLVSSGGQYPTLTLTEYGDAVMRGKGTFRMRWPAPQKRPAPLGTNSSKSQTLEFDEKLYGKLRDHRSKIATEQGIPSFVVFNNQTLEFFARIKPTTVEEGLQIRGVGAKKAERFLTEFVAIIADHLQEL